MIRVQLGVLQVQHWPMPWPQIKMRSNPPVNRACAKATQAGYFHVERQLFILSYFRLGSI